MSTNTRGKFSDPEHQAVVQDYLAEHYVEVAPEMSGFCGRVICILNDKAKEKIRTSQDIDEGVDFDIAVVRNGELSKGGKRKGVREQSPFSILKREGKGGMTYTLYKIRDGVAEIIEKKNGEKIFKSKKRGYLCGPGENAYVAEKHLTGDPAYFLRTRGYIPVWNTVPGYSGKVRCILPSDVAEGIQEKYSLSERPVFAQVTNAQISGCGEIVSAMDTTQGLTYSLFGLSKGGKPIKITGEKGGEKVHFARKKTGMAVLLADTFFIPRKAAQTYKQGLSGNS